MFNLASYYLLGWERKQKKDQRKKKTRKTVQREEEYLNSGKCRIYI